MQGPVGEEFARLPWSDPFVLSTVCMFVWLVLSAAVGLFYRPAREGRKVAWLTLVSFIFLVIALSINFLVETQHSGATGPKEPGSVLEGGAEAAGAPVSGGRYEGAGGRL